jgi:hypothetical protein
MFGVAALHVLGRKRRRKRDSGFEPSLLGDLDRAISQVEYHMRRARTFQWWFLAPAFAITLITYLLKHESKSVWYWPLMLGCMAAAQALVLLEVRCVHGPKSRDPRGTARQAAERRLSPPRTPSTPP